MAIWCTALLTMKESRDRPSTVALKFRKCLKALLPSLVTKDHVKKQLSMRCKSGTSGTTRSHRLRVATRERSLTTSLYPRDRMNSGMFLCKPSSNSTKREGRKQFKTKTSHLYITIKLKILFLPLEVWAEMTQDKFRQIWVWYRIKHLKLQKTLFCFKTSKHSLRLKRVLPQSWRLSSKLKCQWKTYQCMKAPTSRTMIFSSHLKTRKNCPRRKKLESLRSLTNQIRRWRELLKSVRMTSFEAIEMKRERIGSGARKSWLIK